jgi:hypothetical protein
MNALLRVTRKAGNGTNKLEAQGFYGWQGLYRKEGMGQP